MHVTKVNLPQETFRQKFIAVHNFPRSVRRRVDIPGEGARATG